MTQMQQWWKSSFCQIFLEVPGPSNHSNLPSEEWYAIAQDPGLLTRATYKWVYGLYVVVQKMMDQSERHHADHTEANRQYKEIQQVMRQHHEVMEKCSLTLLQLLTS